LWYRGYRPTRNEGTEFEEDLGDIDSALVALSLINQTETIYLGNCSLVREDERLVEREEAVIVDSFNEDSEPLKTELLSLAGRISALEEDFQQEIEIDISDELREWFLDFYALQPCLEELSEISATHDAAVFEVRQEVEEAEVTVNAWEARLASGSTEAAYTLVGIAIAVASTLSAVLL
jgi:hypothetical protein